VAEAAVSHITVAVSFADAELTGRYIVLVTNRMNW
jgi:hypothetical protein